MSFSLTPFLPLSSIYIEVFKRGHNPSLLNSPLQPELSMV
jgi:hypothetical protein